MKKKLSVLILLLCIICQSESVLGVPLAYTPGDKTAVCSFDAPRTLDGAAVSDGTLSLEPGGSATFDLLLRADMVQADISYTAESTANVTISAENKSYTAILSAEQTTAQLSVVLRRGSHVLCIASDSAVQIHSVIFTKAAQTTGTMATYLTEQTDYDAALQTAVILKENSVLLKSSGALRYIDYENPSAVPLKQEGKLYLPIQTAARAFSIYYEDYPDLGYVYLASDTLSIYAGVRGHYIVKDGTKEELESGFLLYQNGSAFLAVRRLAELLGKTVCWRDGFVVIDDRICAETIVKNEDIFAKLKTEFANFNTTNTQSGTSYHVSLSADSETADGSAEHPFATISAAADVAEAGDTILIHEGVYRETVTPRHDGTATAPIIFRAAPGENVTISAFEEVSGFQPYSAMDGIYYAAIPETMGFDRNFVIYRDEILREGRHPNTDTKIDPVTGQKLAAHPGYDGVMRPTMGNITIPENDRTVALCDTGELDQTVTDYWKDGTFVTLMGEGWTLSYAKITGSEQGKLHLQDHRYGNGSYGISYYARVQPSDYGYITNHIRTLDMPGEWYVQTNSRTGKSTLFLVPPEDVTPATLTVEVKQRQRVIDLTDRKCVQFIGINTRGGGVTMAGDSEMCVLNGGTHKYISQFGWSAAHVLHTLRLYETAQNESYSKKVDAPELGETGFFAHGHNNAFINADISYSAGPGIYLTGTYTYVENCNIGHTAYAGGYPSGITVEGVRWDEPTAAYGGHTIVGNTSFGAGRGCMYLSRNYSHPPGDARRGCLPILACDISYNHFYNGNVTARDTGCLYFHGTTGGNDWNKTRVHHNITHDNCTLARDSMLNKTYYFDGNANLNQCYSNLSFATYDGYMSDNRAGFFTQGGDATAQVDQWGNRDLGLRPEGMASLTIQDYPYAKPFYAGARRAEDTRFMENYNEYMLLSAKIAADMTCTGGASLQNKAVYLPNEAAAVTAGGFRFGESGSCVRVYYTSDVYAVSTDAIPQMTVTVTPEGGTPITYQRDVYVHSYEPGTPSELSVLLPSSVSGQGNVSVSASGGLLSIVKIRVDAVDYEAENQKLLYPANASVLYLGSYDWLYRGAGVPNRKFTATSTAYAAGTTWSVSNSNNHTFRYDGRTVSENVSKMTIKLGTATCYANFKINIRVGSRTAEPIATLDVLPRWYGVRSNPQIWYAQCITVDLNEVLPAGTYDFYVECEGDYDTSAYSDVSFASSKFGVSDLYFAAFHN